MFTIVYISLHGYKPLTVLHVTTPLFYVQNLAAGTHKAARGKHNCWSFSILAHFARGSQLFAVAYLRDKIVTIPLLKQAMFCYKIKSIYNQVIISFSQFHRLRFVVYSFVGSFKRVQRIRMMMMTTHD